MAVLRHRQRAITAVSPHANNRRYLIPNRDAASLPPGLSIVHTGALTPGDLDVTVHRTGFDSRVAGDGAIGAFSYTAGEFNNETVEFLFYHWDNGTFYFGNDADGQFGFTQDPIQVAIQGMGFNVTMTWAGLGSEYWTLDGEQANLVGKYLLTRIGAKLAVLVGQ